MAQIIPNEYGNVVGRIGRGFGQSLSQGLAEQIPKEAQRYRLAEGLKQFEKDSDNLSPMQSLSRLASIPGALENPQLIESFGRLAQQKGMRNSYGQKSGQGQERPKEIPKGQSADKLNEIDFANIQKSQRPSDLVKSGEIGQPQVNEKNPLRQEAIPLAPWTPERRDQELNQVAKDFPWMNDQQIKERVSENEQRELAQPLAEQAIDTYNKEQANQIKEAFKTKLELLTQKEGKEVFKDITGEMRNSFERTVAKDIRMNPKLSVEDAVEKRSQQLLDLVKQKGIVKEISNRNIFDRVSPSKKEQALDNLLDAGKAFNNLNDNEEYYNILKSSVIPASEGISEHKGMGLSPMNAAWIAYPINKNLKNFAKTINGKYPLDLKESQRKAQYYASNFANLKTEEDSPLAVAREIYNRDPYMDINLFVDALRELREAGEVTLNPRQSRELTETRDFLPTWGDLTLFPANPRRRAK